MRFKASIKKRQKLKCCNCGNSKIFLSYEAYSEEDQKSKFQENNKIDYYICVECGFMINFMNENEINQIQTFLKEEFEEYKVLSKKLKIIKNRIRFLNSKFYRGKIKSVSHSIPEHLIDVAHKLTLNNTNSLKSSTDLEELISLEKYCSERITILKNNLSKRRIISI